MTFVVRPFAHDFAGIAPLLNTVNASQITPERLEAIHAAFPAEGLRHRAVAVDATGAVIGYANTSRTPSTLPGAFWVTLITAASARRRGVASALLADLESWVRANGGAKVQTIVPEDDAGALAFAQARGCYVDSYSIESSLNVSTFDESPWARAVDQVAASGIRFFTLAERPGDETLERIYELYKVTDLDTPGYQGLDPALYPPYDRWYDDLFGDDRVVPEGLIIAADGDRFIGCTIVQTVGSGSGLYTEYTGVLREYRCRSIGLALKLLSVRFAKHYGAPYMTTRNNSTNAPMLAVNEKMGYVKTSGRAWLMKDLL